MRDGRSRKVSTAQYIHGKGVTKRPIGEAARNSEA
jgi:hypothetical protein